MFLDNRKNISNDFFDSFQKSIVKIAKNKDIKSNKEQEALEYLKQSLAISRELGLAKTANQLQNLILNKSTNPEDFIEHQDLIIV